MQSKGLDFLRPIWTMIHSNQVIEIGSRDKTNGLNLSGNEVSVTYTRYINNYKIAKKDAQPNGETIEHAVQNGLTPGN